jgi:hypothetical protein
MMKQSDLKIGARVRWYGRPGTVVEIKDGRPVLMIDAYVVRPANLDYLMHIDTEAEALH